MNGAGAGPRWLRTLLFVVFLGSAPRTMSAQRIVTGTTVDSTGAPVVLVRVGIGGEEILTGSNGRFRLAVPLADDTVTVAFRRVGYRPRVLRVAPVGGGTIDLGPVTLVAIPIRLDDITVEALEPILTERGVREVTFARREGRSRYFFTAYDIERLRPFDVSDLVRRVPGASRGEDPIWGPVVQLSSRGRRCTASLTVDGMSTHHPSPDLFLTPERIGVLMVDPRACAITVWTKPLPVGAASPFDIGVRVGMGDYAGQGGLQRVGGFLRFPVGGQRAGVQVGFDAGTGPSDLSFQVQAGLRIALPSRTSPAYLGAGVRFQKLRRGGRDDREVTPLLVSGVRFPTGALRPFAEFELSDLTLGRAVRGTLFVGVSYAHR